MDLFEARTKTFILRFWLEARTSKPKSFNWRGMIEYIPNGERHYFYRMEDLPRLLLPYLKEAEADLAPQKSVWTHAWLSSLKKWWQRRRG